VVTLTIPSCAKGASALTPSQFHSIFVWREDFLNLVWGMGRELFVLYSQIQLNGKKLYPQLKLTGLEKSINLISSFNNLKK